MFNRFFGIIAFMWVVLTSSLAESAAIDSKRIKLSQDWLTTFERFVSTVHTHCPWTNLTNRDDDHRNTKFLKCISGIHEDNIRDFMFRVGEPLPFFDLDYSLSVAPHEARQILVAADTTQLLAKLSSLLKALGGMIYNPSFSHADYMRLVDWSATLGGVLIRLHALTSVAQGKKFDTMMASTVLKGTGRIDTDLPSDIRLFLGRSDVNSTIDSRFIDDRYLPIALIPTLVGATRRLNLKVDSIEPIGTADSSDLYYYSDFRLLLTRDGFLDFFKSRSFGQHIGRDVNDRISDKMVLLKTAIDRGGPRYKKYYLSIARSIASRLRYFQVAFAQEGDELQNQGISFLLQVYDGFVSEGSKLLETGGCGSGAF